MGMENKESYLEFVSSESYKHQIDVWSKTYNISREKIELFYDFLISLYDLVNNTYLGEDFLQSEEEQRSHFTWCWDKTIDSFNKEKIFFKERDSCYEYFWNFFLEAYYFAQFDGNHVRIGEYFYKLFDFKHRKTRSELDMLTEIYKMFEQNLKK
jgi:hypothetical protein